jgi:uncharacterized protein YjdB
MRKHGLVKKIRKRAVALSLALMLGTSLAVDTTGVSAEEAETSVTEESDTEEELLEIDTDIEMSNQRLYSGASTKKFYTSGTDGEMPDDEWKALKKRLNKKVGSTGVWCTDYVTWALKLPNGGVGSTSTAKSYLLNNGYYQVVKRTDLTDGTNFTSKAKKTLAKIRRGDILLFSDDAGTYHHIAIASVDSDGVIYMYEAGMGSSREVRLDNISYYLSGSTSANDGYADNIEVFRKVSQKTTTTETSTATDDEYNNTVAVRYTTHVQSYGWQDDVNNDKTWKYNGALSGTTGESKRLEAIMIKVTGPADLGVAYNTHVQSRGWQASTTDSSKWKKDGALSGTSGKSKRLEAIQIKLTGADADKYNIYYRVHAQTYGWLGWAKNGEIAGTSGQSKRLEAIEIVILPVSTDGSADATPDTGIIGYSYIELGKSANNTGTEGMVNYMTHVQTYGDQSYVYDGSISGTEGESKRLEGIRIKLNKSNLGGLSGGVRYTTHVQSYGWQKDVNDSTTWKKNGAFSGTSGKGKRLEAIKIELYGAVAEKYDIYYRVHVQSYGWLGWAKNGETAGTTGLSKRLEGIQIVLVPKGSAAPGSTKRSSIVKK